jgi:hypothetical protein
MRPHFLMLSSAQERTTVVAVAVAVVAVFFFFFFFNSCCYCSCAGHDARCVAPRALAMVCAVRMMADATTEYATATSPPPAIPFLVEYS